VSEPLLDVRGLSMHFALRGGLARRVRREGHEVLRAVDGVDLQIGRGETLGLVGESGCGKSTLGRCIVGLYEPTGGQIRYGGALLPTQRDRATRRRIQMVFQDPYSSLNPRMTVRQTLAELLTAHRMVPKRSAAASCSTSSASARARSTRTRASSRAASASACRSHVRSRWSRSCSSRTSRSRRSTSRCRRRC
jgi:ABC-type oligopeptide transport system ATPase subunit